MAEQNPYWNPAWQRKQKRTTGQEPANPEQSKDLTEDIKKLLPSSALVRHSKLTIEEFTQLIEALEFYAINDPSSYSVSYFIIKHTKLEPDFISHYFERNKENPLIHNAKGMFSRARKAFEANLTRPHARTNPQFAQFLLKNKFGYIDKTEGGGNTTNIAIDARSFLQQLGKLPETVVQSKHLEQNNNPTDTPKAINQ